MVRSPVSKYIHCVTSPINKYAIIPLTRREVQASNPCRGGGDLLAQRCGALLVLKLSIRHWARTVEEGIVCVNYTTI